MFKTKSLYKAFVMISYLLLVNSLNSGLLQTIQSNQQQDLSTLDNNDELGGSLLEVVLPTSSEGSSSSNLFAIPPPPPSPEPEPVTPVSTPLPPKQNSTETNNTATNTTSTLPQKDLTETNTTSTNATSDVETGTLLNNQNGKSKFNKIVSAIKDVSVTEPNVETITKVMPIIVYSNKTCDEINTESLHAPYSSPDTANMRYLSILSIIIFGSSYLILRGLFNQLKDVNKFFAKGIKMLSHQLLLLFMCIGFILVVYSYGLLDKIKINWQYVLSGITLMIMCWFIFCLLILFLSLFIIRKWEQLESNAKDFSKIFVTYI